MKYRDAGVDVTRAEAMKERLGRAVRATWGSGVVPLPSGFAGVTAWPGAAEGRETLLLAATMDGVGTKLHLAKAAGRLADAAGDVVRHGANDLLVHGATPLAVLDYVAQAKLDPEVVQAVVEGIARACGEVGAALLGGETAEMPDTYLPDVVDVAACMIGTVARARLLDGSRVRARDVVLGLGADGLHTNGFSLARAVLRASGRPLTDPLPGGDGESIGEALLAPHRAYGAALRPLLDGDRLHALAHVTGGGIAGNLVRVLPEGRRARVAPDAWPRSAVFRWLIDVGGIPEGDARQALNLGIGMVAVCAPEAAPGVEAALVAAGEKVWRLGEILDGPRGVEWTDGVA